MENTTNNQTVEQQQTTASETTKGKKPELKVYKKDADGKKILESEIALWKNISKDGTKVYYSGKDKQGNKYVAFINEPEQQ